MLAVPEECYKIKQEETGIISSIPKKYYPHDKDSYSFEDNTFYKNPHTFKVVDRTVLSTEYDKPVSNKLYVSLEDNPELTNPLEAPFINFDKKQSYDNVVDHELLNKDKVTKFIQTKLVKDSNNKFKIVRNSICIDDSCGDRLLNSADVVNIIGSAYNINDTHKESIRRYLNKLLETEFFIPEKYLQPILEKMAEDGQAFASISKFVKSHPQYYNSKIVKYFNDIKQNLVIIDILTLLMRRDKACEDVVKIITDKLQTLIKLNQLRLEEQKGSGLNNYDKYFIKYLKYKSKCLHAFILKYTDALHKFKY